LNYSVPQENTLEINLPVQTASEAEAAAEDFDHALVTV